MNKKKPAMKYNPVHKLQYDVGLNAPAPVIFDAAAQIESGAMPGPPATCTALELLKLLYDKDGGQCLTVTLAAQELGVERSGIYNRRAQIMRRLHDILTQEADNV